MSVEKVVRGKRLNDDQKEKLIKFMQEHAMFASGKYDSINGKQKYLQTWSDLASELNNLGPEKSVVQYQAYWKQKKYQSRQANSKRKSALKMSTGNKELPPEPSFTEQMVLSIIGTETSEGIHGIPEGGFEDWHNTSNESCEKMKENDKIYELEMIDIDDTFGLNGNCSTLQASNVLEQLEPVTATAAIELTNSNSVKTNIKNKKSTYIEELLEINNGHMANISSSINEMAKVNGEGMVKMAEAMTKMAGALEKLAESISVGFIKI